MKTRKLRQQVAKLATSTQVLNSTHKAECIALAQRIVDLQQTNPEHYRRVMAKLEELEAREREAKS